MKEHEKSFKWYDISANKIKNKILMNVISDGIIYFILLYAKLNESMEHLIKKNLINSTKIH